MLTHSPEGIPVLEPQGLVRRRFFMTLGVAAVIGVVAVLLMPAGSNDRVLGGGSTVAQPLIERMAVSFQTARSGDTDWTASSDGIDYEPTGSLGGFMRLSDPEFDFAITDYPLSTDALAERDAVQFPLFVGSIAVVYRLDDLQQPLQLSPATLADIFNGQITTWADPSLAAENAGITLPDTPITVIHRSDGSGSTLNWSTYIARGDSDWARDTGAGTTLEWAVGVGVRGSGEMTNTVAQTNGAIGYLDTGAAHRAGLAMARLRNGAGMFVEPNEASVTAAARDISLAEAHATTIDTDNDAYPIVAASYVVMKKNNASSGDNRRVLRFFSFLLEQQTAIRELGYLSISPQDIDGVRHTWVREFGFQAADNAISTP